LGGDWGRTAMALDRSRAGLELVNDRWRVKGCAAVCCGWLYRFELLLSNWATPPAGATDAWPMPNQFWALVLNMALCRRQTDNKETDTSL